MTLPLLAALSVWMLAECSRGQSALDGTQWWLTEWTLSSHSPRVAVFAEVKISGHGGANGYGGRYTLGPRHALAVRPPASTRMPGPEPAMRAEGANLTLLDAGGVGRGFAPVELQARDGQRVLVCRGRLLWRETVARAQSSTRQ